MFTERTPACVIWTVEKEIVNETKKIHQILRPVKKERNQLNIEKKSDDEKSSLDIRDCDENDVNILLERRTA